MADHLALPLRVNSTGRMGALAQDSTAEVAQSVALLLSTRVGERLSVPGYGTPPALFGVQRNVSGISAAIDSWEPRAGDYDLELDVNDPAAPVVTVALSGSDAGATISAQLVGA